MLPERPIPLVSLLALPRQNRPLSIDMPSTGQAYLATILDEALAITEWLSEHDLQDVTPVDNDGDVRGTQDDQRMPPSQ